MTFLGLLTRKNRIIDIYGRYRDRIPMCLTITDQNDRQSIPKRMYVCHEYDLKVD